MPGPSHSARGARVAVVGGGAAGLMAALVAARTLRERGAGGGVVLLDGASKLGAKILVSGGGRCNVTHHEVTERDFAGASPGAIRRVLRRFDVAATVAFFREIGVELRREETGKLFPVTDRARTVLDALLRAARDAGVEIRNPCRVETVARAAGGGFVVRGGWGLLESGRVVLATGGKSLPKTGSDGRGYDIARGLGHTTTSSILPALVPLTLPDGNFLRALSGVAAPVRLEVRSSSGAKLVEVRGALLATHFGISGPAVLDVSRHLLHARLDDPEATLVVRWLADVDCEEFDRRLSSLGRAGAGSLLRSLLPVRLADALCREAGVEPGERVGSLSRERRRRLVDAACRMVLPVTGDRGFRHAEVTAGGVPLTEVRLETIESRAAPGLHLCGEILDVDGRIGGFNFQWAWASGFVAGVGAAAGAA